MTDVADLTAIGSAQITVAAANQKLTSVTLGNGLAGVSGFMRFAGTGGTSVTAWLQQSPDSGTTWLDAYCAKFTAAGVAQFSLVQGAGANLAATDATLADNTALNGGTIPLFADWRLQWTSVGTWANGTLVCEAMPRG
jgi:hypothetical protein